MVEAIIWCAHDGRGAPYVAVPRGEEPRGNINWKSRDGQHLPGLDIGAAGVSGEWMFAEADRVGIAHGRGPGCFSAKYGPAGLDAEAGIPARVSIQLSANGKSNVY